jgi:hypothetical protein
MIPMFAKVINYNPKSVKITENNLIKLYLYKSPCTHVDMRNLLLI